MDITSGLLELLSGEIMGLPGGWSNMASETQNSCHNYKLEGSSTCNTGIPNKTLYIELPAFDPVQYRETEEGFENANKEKVVTWSMKEPVVKFVIAADGTIHNLFEIIGMHETITFTNLVNSQSANVKTVKVQAAADEMVTRLEITLDFIDAGIEHSICCGSYYEDAPFTECDGEGETGDPSNDPVCVGFEVEIEVTEGPDLLTANITNPGGAVGPVTYIWYRDGVVIPGATGASLTPTLPGTYRVDVFQGNCQATHSVTWSNACEGFELAIQTIVMGDGATLLIALPNLIPTLIQWQELIAAVWTDITGETGITYQPDHTGTYRVRGEAAGGCSDESDPVDVTVEGDPCNDLYSIELENVDGTPTVTINDYAGEGTPSYSWFYDDGTGLVPGPWTGPTVPNAEPGLYLVVVTLDGCIQSLQLFINCESTPSGGCNGDPCCDVEWFQEFIGTGTETTFHVTNFTLPNPALLSENQIEAKLLVVRDTNTASYRAAPNGASQYAIDYAGQNITISADFPLEDGSVLTIRKIRL